MFGSDEYSYYNHAGANGEIEQRVIDVRGVERRRAQDANAQAMYPPGCWARHARCMSRTDKRALTPRAPGS